MNTPVWRPRGILFLCVNNSARSQTAEGIARALMPPEVQVWSAGSNPTSVRPEAIVVLQEIGIDISRHRSKSLSEIPADEVDTVITLCSEEICPVVPEHVLHLHWALPDPAGIVEPQEERLAAFRKTRDELHRQISTLIEVSMSISSRG